MVRGGLALCWKPDSLRRVAISTGTGTPYLRSALFASERQFSNQPFFWSNTRQTSLMWLGAEAQPHTVIARANTDTIILKRGPINQNE